MIVIIILWSVVGVSIVLIAFILTHLGDPYARLEHEVDTIRHQAARGWSSRRIRRLHPRFCACQIDYVSHRPRHYV